MRIAVVSQKGGVGKTTTAVHLAAGLAMAGHRVLLVDIDAQGNASSTLRAARGDRSPGTAEVLFDRLPVAQAVRPVPGIEGLSLMPGATDLAKAPDRLGGVKFREQRLRKALDAYHDADHIIIDCPPHLGIETVNAMLAADALLVTLRPSKYTMEGLADLVAELEDLREYGHEPKVAYVVTMLPHNERSPREYAQDAREAFGDQVCEAVIRRAAAFEEAASHDKTLFEYRPEHEGAADYARLVVELANRWALNTPATAEV